MTRHTTPEGVFEIASLPSQSQVAVSHAFQVKEHLRGQGNAKFVHADQIAIMEEHGYDYAICTVTGDNKPQFKALENAGWDLLAVFHNSRVSGPTRLYGIELNQVSNVAELKARKA